MRTPQKRSGAGGEPTQRGLSRLTGLKTRAVACRERLLAVAQHELISRNVLTDDGFASPQIRADVERGGSRVVYARGS
jgi:hypothetical protein